jgi:feruloyl-CoA synthase
MNSAGATRMRPVRIAPTESVVRPGAGGVVYMQSPCPLGAYPVRITDRLEHWARAAPDRSFLAQRQAPAASDASAAGVAGDWRHVTYVDALARVRRIGQALLDRGLSPDRPIVILSGNGIEHGLLALAAMYTGVLYAPVAPAYSLQAREFSALHRIFARVNPALVFAAEGARYERALRAVLSPGMELVTCSPPGDLPWTPFAALEQTPATPAVDDAHRRVDADTIAKVLFTSGSTGNPKGVINTQRMLCSNQEMIRSVLLFLADEPPVICDWSPWNHTAGGNHNFGLTLYNGGTLYIDEGKPTPALFGTTVRNLREVPCTAHFAVPRLYEMLMPHLHQDVVLRETFFRRLRLLFYAAAGLGQRFWDELRDLAIEACGEEILIMTGFGCTETAPFTLSTGSGGAFAGMVGWPGPGIDLKLAPVGSKLEARVRGPNVTPGYWQDEALTRAAFDEEGYYRLGDAMRFVDPSDPGKGLIFDGRLAEDFKLSTGTWVSVGPLRARILAEAAGCAQDVVIAGPDRDFVTALIFPNLAVCRTLCDDPGGDASAREVVRHPQVVRRFRSILDRLARQSTGSSTFVARAILLDEPPSLDAREMTDKGSLNQKVVLANRAALVEELYAAVPSSHVLVATPAAQR